MGPIWLGTEPALFKDALSQCAQNVRKRKRNPVQGPSAGRAHEPPSAGPFSSFHREPTLGPKVTSIELS